MPEVQVVDNQNEGEPLQTETVPSTEPTWGDSITGLGGDDFHFSDDEFAEAPPAKEEPTAEPAETETPEEEKGEETETPAEPPAQTAPTAPPVNPALQQMQAELELLRRQNLYLLQHVAPAPNAGGPQTPAGIASRPNAAPPSEAPQIEPLPTLEKFAEGMGLPADDPVTRHIYRQEQALHQLRTENQRLQSTVQPVSDEHAENLRQRKRDEQFAANFDWFLEQSGMVPETWRADIKASPDNREALRWFAVTGQGGWEQALDSYLAWRAKNMGPAPAAKELGRKEGFREATVHKARGAAANLTSASPPRTGRPARAKMDFESAFEKGCAAAGLSSKEK